MTGTVKFLDEVRGFGFIQPDDGGRAVYLNWPAIRHAGLIDHVAVGVRVGFYVVPDRKGGLKATDLCLAG